MPHIIAVIILVFRLVANITNVFSLQNLLKSIELKFMPFLVIIHTTPFENSSLQKLDANL